MEERRASLMELIAEVQRPLWRAAATAWAVELVKEIEDLKAERAKLLLQVSEQQKLIEKAARLLSVCEFDQPMDVEDRDAVMDAAEKRNHEVCSLCLKPAPDGPHADCQRKWNEPSQNLCGVWTQWGQCVAVPPCAAHPEKAK